MICRISIFLILIIFNANAQSFLSSAEKAWLQEHSENIRFGVYKTYPPIEFLDENNRHQGITADYLNQIENMLNVHFSRVHCRDWMDLIQKAKTKQVDFVGCIQKTKEREKFLLFTSPYIEIPNVIITQNIVKRDLTIEQLMGMRITAVQGYANINYVLHRQQNIHFIPCKDDASGLQMVSLGRVDAMISDLAVTSYYIQKLGINNLRVAGDIDFNWMLRFGIRNDWPIFQNILEKTLQHINANSRREIYNKWIPLQTSGYIQKKHFLMVVIVISMLALVLILLIYLWNRMLKKQVRQNTAILRKQLRERERISKRLRIRNAILQVFVETPEKAVYSSLLKALCLSLKSTISFIGYFDEEQNLNITFYSWPLEKDISLNLPLKAWQNSVIKEITNANNLNESIELQQLIPKPLQQGLLSGVAVPLKIQNSIFGILGFFMEKTSIPADEKEILKEIAKFISPILFAQLQKQQEAHKRAQLEEERRQLEHQYRHAQKMESLGTLAGGIAHDFNNILSSIMGFTELTLLNPNLNEQLRHNLEQILKASLRASDLVQQILAFSRQGKQEFKVFSINPLIKEAVKMLRSIIPSSIELKLDLPKQPLYLEGDPSQIHQVLINLVTNAKQALENENGSIMITVNEVILSQPISNPWFKAEKGKYVQLKVCDTGKGMETAIMEQIFDPFFTTKGKNEGTGLGLTIVHNIIKSHKGFIDVQTSLGKGSCFQVLFPAVEYQRLKPQEQVTLTKNIPKGKGTILFIDDEKPITDLHATNLRNAGYQVFDFTDSEMALHFFKANKAKIDLVISDVTMPKISGLKLIQELRRLKPDVPIILCTGFSDQIDAEVAIKKYGVQEFLMKPIDLKQMAVSVHKILNNH